MKNKFKMLFKNFIKLENSLLILLMAFLGISTSCEKSNESPAEYGTPHANFIVNGKVVASSTNEAIKDIQVIMQRDTTYTNDKGEYSVKMEGFPNENTYILEIKDIDGEQNGSFEEKDITVDFSDEEFNNGDGKWYKGEKEKSVDVSLNNKTE